MRRITFISTILILFLSITVLNAEATVITFDDLFTDGTLAPLLPDNYKGINWTNWHYWDWEQYPYTPHSGNVRITDWSDNANLISWSKPVDFQGAWFSGNSFQPGFGPVNVKFEGYLNNILQGTSQSLQATATPAYLAANFDFDVDAIRVVTDNPGGYFALDDLTFSPNIVPEPVSALIFAFGGTAIALIRRKQFFSSRDRR